MLCVLAENGDMSRDVAYNIHTTLLEAFCLENDIWMIKVRDMFTDIRSVIIVIVIRQITITNIGFVV